MARIKPDATDQTVDVFIQDSSSTVGAGLTALVYNTSGLTCYYRRGATGTVTVLSLATQTVGGAHSDGGFVLLDDTNSPGMYRLDLSDEIVASGVPYAWVYLQGAANMAPTPVLIELEPVESDMVEINANATAADNFEIGCLGLTFSTSKAGTLTTTAMSTNLTEATDDHYIGKTITWTTGVLLGQSSDITDYVGVNGVLTYSTVTDAPGSSDQFVLY